jgi:probable HAF family extracellular repeat protein
MLENQRRYAKAVFPSYLPIHFSSILSIHRGVRRQQNDQQKDHRRQPFHHVEKDVESRNPVGGKQRQLTHFTEYKHRDPKRSLYKQPDPKRSFGVFVYVLKPLREKKLKIMMTSFSRFLFRYLLTACLVFNGISILIKCTFTGRPSSCVPLGERVMLDLRFLPNGVEFSRGFNLNANGVVTGESDNNISKAFIFDPNIGTMTALFDLIISNPDNMNTAGGFGAGINDSNQIVGTMSRFTSPPSSVIRGFKFEDGTVRDLGSIDGLTTTPARAWGINNSGAVVGLSRNANGVSHATLLENGAATDLGSLGGAMAFSEAFRINDRGKAVGRSTVVARGTGQNAVLWENGSIRDLGRFPGLNFARANDINEKGVIVGTVSQFEGFSGRAAIWRQGETTPTDLNTLLPANSGWTLLTSAECLNDHGQIVGFGTINGQTRAFLMTPYYIALQDNRRGVETACNI